MSQLEPLLVTLDTNAVIALAEGEEPNASAVRKLAELQRRGMIKLWVDISTARERQRPGTPYKLHEVIDLRALGLGDVDYFAGPCLAMGFQVDGQPSTTSFDSGLQQWLMNLRLTTAE